MAERLGEALLDLDTRDRKYNRSVDAAGRRAQGLGRVFDGVASKASALGRNMARAFTVLATVQFGLAVRGALQLDAALGEVSTLLPDVESGLEDIEAASHRMAREFATSATEQAQGFYQAISAGASDAAEATEILEAANRLAVGGVTDVGTGVDGLTSILNAYGDRVESVEAVSDALFVGMRSGKTTIGELATNIGKVSPIAASLGVEFDELVSAIAALTLSGISTAESITGVRAILAAVAKPTAEATELAERLGLQFDTNAIKAQGFAGFLQDVMEKTNGSTDQLAQLFGGVEALVPAMALAGSAGTSFNDILGQMEDKAGATSEAFDRIASRDSFKAKQAIAQIQDVFTDLAQGILTASIPALNEFALKIADPAFAQNAQTMANWIIGAVNAVVDAFNLGIEAARSFANALAWMENTTVTEFVSGDFSGTPDLAEARDDAMEQLRLQLSESSAAQPFSNMRFMGDPFEDMAQRAADALDDAGFDKNFFQPFRQGAEDAAGALEGIEPSANAAEFSIDDLADALGLSGETAGALGGNVSALGDDLDDLVDDAETAADAFADAFSGMGSSILSNMRRGGDAAEAVLDSLLDRLFDLSGAWMDSVLNQGFSALGQLLFGGGGEGGLFAGMFSRGGLIPSGSFGIVGENGPEPVIGTSRGAMVLPNSAMRSAGEGGARFNFQQNITPPPGYETRTQEEDEPGGKRQDVWFEEAVAGAIKSPRGQKAVRSSGRIIKR